jgi:rSAM/selenodomain-associated transferase 2
MVKQERQSKRAKEGMLEREPCSYTTFSVVIPTLNEAQTISATLEALARMHGNVEVIVVDGGSDDETVDIAEQHGVTVITAERGRGTQMHAGACAARGEVLWFVHADTLPPVDGAWRIHEALQAPDIIGGHFQVRFDGTSRPARFLTRLYPHLRWVGLGYGDATLFVRRDVYEQAGGFRPFPIFEDVDLVRRLRQYGQLVGLPVPVITSSRRFEGRSFTLTLLRWMVMQGLYWLGCSPHWLGRLYPAIRGLEAASTGRQKPVCGLSATSPRTSAESTDESFTVRSTRYPRAMSTPLPSCMAMPKITARTSNRRSENSWCRRTVGSR